MVVEEGFGERFISDDEDGRDYFYWFLVFTYRRGIGLKIFFGIFL